MEKQTNYSKSEDIYEEELVEQIYVDKELSKQLITKEQQDYKNCEYDPFLKNLEKRRWLIMLMYCAYQFTNAMNWCSYAGILNQTKKYYNQDLDTILWFSNAYTVSFVILSYLGCYLLEVNTSICIIFGSFINGLGMWIKYIAKDNFTLALIGQITASIGQIFTLQTPIFFAEKWFHFKERFFVLSIMFNIFYMGSSFGYIFSPIMIGNDEQQIPKVLFIEALLGTIPFILCIAIIKNKPNHPPNFTASVKKLSFWKSCKILIRNSNYIFAMLFFSIALSHSWTITAIIGDWLDNGVIEASPTQIGILGLVYSISGLIGSLLASLFLEKQTKSKQYFDLLLKFLLCLSFFALIALTFIIQSGYISLVYTCLVILGIGLVGIIPFACTAIEEIAYGTSDSASQNTLFLFGNAICCIASIVAIQPMWGQYKPMVLIMFSIPVMIYFLFFYKTNFVKSNMEGSRFSSFHE